MIIKKHFQIIWKEMEKIVFPWCGGDVNIEKIMIQTRLDKCESSTQALNCNKSRKKKLKKYFAMKLQEK